MTRWIFVGTVAVTVMFGVSASRNTVFACSKTTGCIMESLREDYDMKHDGRMDKAMAAGRANIEAFRALQAAQQNGPARR